MSCRDLQDANFMKWVRANATWLMPYAAFCFLRDLFGSADHREWGLMHHNALEHTRRVTSPSQPYHREILFTCWLQWHLHEQLLDVSQYARTKRVVLKGDLPIGVAKCSADTWCNPHLFHMDVSVGSPPDAFDSNGQNWGFPGAHLVTGNASNSPPCQDTSST
jgi:4-alpha-glucanotransferase